MDNVFESMQRKNKKVLLQGIHLYFKIQLLKDSTVDNTTHNGCFLKDEDNNFLVRLWVRWEIDRKRCQ